jgi:predicted AlkP superfamily pyrophosphatase or phosphodiesterase
MRRVVFVLADGLRPDAITPSRMPSLEALGSAYTLALHATTVRPSTTVAALTSLATGLSPATHGFTEPGLGFLRRLAQLRPAARELGRAGHATEIVAGDLTPIERNIGGALVGAAGIARLTAGGRCASDVAQVGLAIARTHSRGVVFVYLNDCDRAGHEHGWMSDPYLAAAAQVDAAIGALAALAEDSLFIVTADHGGGGVTSNDHGEPHPTNDRIPLVLAGPAVTRRHQLTRAVSILDLPPTLLWWFGLEVPASYEGRVLSEAFVRAADSAEVAA